jgi:hypothetical protein
VVLDNIAGPKRTDNVANTGSDGVDREAEGGDTVHLSATDGGNGVLGISNWAHTVARRVARKFGTEVVRLDGEVGGAPIARDERITTDHCCRGRRETKGNKARGWGRHSEGDGVGTSGAVHPRNRKRRGGRQKDGIRIGRSTCRLWSVGTIGNMNIHCAARETTDVGVLEEKGRQLSILELSNFGLSESSRVAFEPPRIEVTELRPILLIDGCPEGAHMIVGIIISKTSDVEINNVN